ncbi:MAG: NADH:flavin oxidoreductase/NADH oxidase [Anaerolineae bacterium]|nr:NADH:flavin oxidoreductase/NADH oxidase [Chloroflexota bacterium]
MPGLFDPLTIQDVTLRNRLMMSPMCQYVAGDDGLATDWHLVHYGARASGGVGLVMIEATSVLPGGRLSRGDLGLWDDAQIEPLARIVRYCHSQGAHVGVQLGHGGRKAWSDDRAWGPEVPVAPSAVAFDEGWRMPVALDQAGIDDMVEAFARAARRAREAGVDVIEIHGAHGYLISEFLSPLANRRQDSYGGDHQNRARLAVEVARAIRSEWGPARPLFARLSCTDWEAGGNTPADAAIYAQILRSHGVDLIDCSSGGVAPVRPRVSPGYQVPFASEVRAVAGVPVAAVGLISLPQQADAIIRNQQADLVALGRALLRSPYWPQYAARTLGVAGHWPKPYDGVAQMPVYPER